MYLLIALAPEFLAADDTAAETDLQLLIFSCKKAGLTIWQGHLVNDV